LKSNHLHVFYELAMELEKDHLFYYRQFPQVCNFFLRLHRMQDCMVLFVLLKHLHL
jgi:hypothetical protein